MAYDGGRLSGIPDPGDALQRRTRIVSEQAWLGYVENCGNWIGKRALSNSRGRVLLDLPTRVVAERLRTPQDEEFVLWTTSVKTADGIDEAQVEWSRPELAEFGALVADGSFSVGADIFQGEPISVDQCIFDETPKATLRVRTTHAFDWEGCLSGIVASRERRLPDSDKYEADGKRLSTKARLGLGFVEPAAWRSPQILFDYIQGEWEGRGLSVDSRTGETYNLVSRWKLKQGKDDRVSQSSVIRIAGGGPSRVFDAEAKVDENLLIYAEANVQVFLLPGGISVSSPIRIRSGRPFALETTFLMRPDCRKRVVRLYNRDCDWVNTLFINERRVE